MSTQTRFVTNHLITPKSVVVVFDSGMPAIIPCANSAYGRICELLRNGQLDLVPDMVDVATRIARSTKGKFVVENGCVNIDGATLPRSLSDKLLELVDKGLSTKPLELFWDNLAQNPSQASREDLFDFIKANNVPLTRDGCFLTYKMVRDDWLDVHSGTILNRVGDIVSVPRDAVDADRRNTCSRGLHVAAFEYASAFHNGRLLECKVNPRDVVAVPPDYAQQKMRVCQYEILRETNTKFCEDIYAAEQETTLNRLVERVLKVQVTRDSEGRARIPSALMRAAEFGVGYDAEVVALASEKTLVVRVPSDDESADAWSTYTVQSDNSIRISNDLIESAGLIRRQVLNVEVMSDNTIRIT